jgi:hypothetical protein
VTSHSSQGQTADRVLIHADTDKSEHLVNARFAYVAVSRGRYDAQIYTNDKSELAQSLSRDVSHRTAIGGSQESAHGETNDNRAGASSHDTTKDQDTQGSSSGQSLGTGQGHGLSDG